MNAKDFVKSVVNSGYANELTALLYTAKHPKEVYGEDDIIEVYRLGESLHHSMKGRSMVTPAIDKNGTIYYTGGKTTKSFDET